MTFKELFLKNLGFRIFLIRTLIFGILLILISLLIIPLQKIPISPKYTPFFYPELGNVILFSIVAFIILSRNKLLSIQEFKFKTKESLSFLSLLLLDILFYVFFKIFLSLNSPRLDNFFIYLLIIKYFLMLLLVLFLALSVFGLETIKYILKNFKKETITVIITALITYLSVEILKNSWQYLSFVVTHAVYFLLKLTRLNPILHIGLNNLGGPMLGAGKFIVNIGKPCSGIDSLTLFTLLYLFILFVDWKELNKKRMLFLFIPGAIGMFAVNIIRIYILMLIGILYSPDFAIGAFHSNAGWIFFIIYAIIFWGLVYKRIRISKKLKSEGIKILLYGIREKKEENNSGPLRSGYYIYNSLKKNGLDIDIYPKFSFSTNYIIKLFSIYKRLFASYYDLIQFNTAPVFENFSFFLLLTRKPIVTNIRGIKKIEDSLNKSVNTFLSKLKIKKENFILECLIKRSNLLILNSSYSAKSFWVNYEVPKNKIKIIPNGLNLEELGIKDKIVLKGSPTLLYVGEISYLKGIDILLNSLAIIKKQYSAIHLHLVGKINKNFEREFYSLIKRKNLVGTITLYGSIPHNKVFSFYRGSDICIFPSRHESFGVSILEAMAVGKPIITTKYGALDFVHNLEDGVLISPFEKEITKAVYKLLKNKKLNNKIGKNAEITAKKYSWDDIAILYLKEFKKIINSN